MKKRVPSTSPESQAHLEESTAEMPSSMKMTVSAQLARVFIVYLTAVRDLWEMLASTYFLQPRPHTVTLGDEWRDKASDEGLQEAQPLGCEHATGEGVAHPRMPDSERKPRRQGGSSRIASGSPGIRVQISRFPTQRL